MNVKSSFLGIAVSFLALTTFAAPVAQNEAERAAAAFVENDSLGSALLGGRSIAGIQKRGELWIVALQPSGHIILSASDLAAPIIGFSENNFTEPDPESPAYGILQAASDRIRRIEEAAATERDPQWDELLNPAARRLLGASPVENPTITYLPLLSSHFDQLQPYNDFSPLYNADTNTTAYRGRCPCGCVATAAAAEAHYFRWPARIDNIVSYDHSLTTSSGKRTFPIHFNGHNPIEWDKIEDEYSYAQLCYYTNYFPNGRYSWYSQWEYDLRGKVPETKRFHIARLILWMDVLAKMSFGSGSSGANFDDIDFGLSEWYTRGRWVTNSFDTIHTYIGSGVPCQVSIEKRNSAGQRLNGHQVIFHGWATKGSQKLVRVNYGWGGSNDGWYDINNTLSDESGEYWLDKIFVGHFPRAKPQLDPLPTVCPTSLTLNWHFPDFYTNKLSRFTITAQKMGTTPTTFSDNFSSSTGASSSPTKIYVGTDSDYTLDGNLLYAQSQASGYWTFPGIYTLTASSVLTFKILSFAALGMTCEIQAKTVNGDWQTIYTPVLKTDWGSSGWSTERIYMGGMGGQSISLRVAFIYDNSYYYTAGRILIDDFQVTSVLAQDSPQTYSAAASDRSMTLSGLTAGSTYAFAVTPTFRTAPSIAGTTIAAETSEPVTVAIAGTRRTPSPGEESYTTQNLSFSSTDTSGVWSYTGTANGSTTINGASQYNSYQKCSASANIYGKLTSSSSVSFSWTANEYYGIYQGSDSFDVIRATFTDSSGLQSEILNKTNRTVKTTKQNESINLSQFSGKSGVLSISFSHIGAYYSSSGQGITISSPRITNIRVPSVPAVTWQSEAISALGTPEIQSVKTVAEGFYKGCGVGTTLFTVKCSDNVTSLTAHSSHPLLLSDENITYANNGNGEWTVAITPTGVTSANYRSRMILTLEATDSNGTKVYKDLSLRFDAVEEVITDDEGGSENTGGGDEPVVVVIDPTTPAGEKTVSIPPAWFEQYWPTETDRSSLGATDSDGDGIPNWQEFICGTDPTNADEKIDVTCSIWFDANGELHVESSLDGKPLADGFREVLKCSDDLITWEETQPGVSSKHFFKVVIEPNE